MKKRHIVHLSTYPADDIRVFQKACKTEVSEGYRVTEIVCGTEDQTVEGVEIRCVPSATGRISRVIKLSWRMYRAAIQERADLYQIHHPDLIPAGLLLKSSRKKVIYEPREFFPDKILSMRWIPEWLRPMTRAVFGFYERTTSVLWNHIIVADRYSARGFSGRPVSVVPNYPLLTPVKASCRPGKKTHKLIYVGGLSQERGLLVMLKIAELLRAHNVELELMGRFGFPEDEGRIHAIPNVRYLGNQDLNAVYSHLLNADLGLLLLQPVPAYTYAGENTLKLFEYMWCGLPVVSSDFPKLKEIIESADCGICIDPCDAENAADAILKLLNDRELRRELARNGRNAVIEAYNWPAASNVMSHVYRNVLNGERASVVPLPLWKKGSVKNSECATA